MILWEELELSARWVTDMEAGIPEAIGTLRMGGPQEFEEWERDPTGVSTYKSENKIKLHIPDLHLRSTESEPETLGCILSMYI